MVERTTSEVSTQYVATPTDLLEVKNIDVEPSTGNPLEFVPPQVMDNLRASGGDVSGTPSYYTIIGEEFEFYPNPSATDIRVTYYQAIPALADEDENWLLTKSPDLYMAASLTEAYAFLFDPESAMLWNAKATQIIAAMNTEADRAEYSGSPLKMRARSF